jgi:hypothetical protein
MSRMTGYCGVSSPSDDFPDALDCAPMSTILLIGSDTPLLEGLAQTLAAVGHLPLIAGTLGDATDLAHATPPLIAVLERSLAFAGDAFRMPLAPGGTLVLYRTAREPAPPLTPALQRLVLADVTLPLERKRLVALVQHVTERAQATGRGPVHTPPDHHAPLRSWERVSGNPINGGDAKRR